MAASQDIAPQERRIRGFCALCRSRCGCVSVVEDGTLVRVEPDPEHPTGQAICAKARAAPELVHSGERLTHPMRRTARKGADDPGWQRISWQEALDSTARAMTDAKQAGGAEAVAFSVTTPSGTAMADAIPFVERLIRGFGSPNTVYGTEICNWHKDHATAFTFGAGVGAPDYEQTGCLVHWGHNPNTSWLTHAERTAAAKARGARLVVVDPRRVGGAVKADQWLRVRPGYDGALALAIAAVMIDNGWIDEAFLRRWSTGPFLIDADTGRFLTGADLAPGGGDETYVAWDASSGVPAVCEPGAGEVDLALSGAFTVETLAGPRQCRTAFDLYAELARS
jgi:anaerobic selenocysteine-containing dehydrogenase